MGLRHRLLNCQKRLSKNLKRSATTYLGTLPPHLEKYAEEYYRELREYEKICNKTDILDEVFKSQLILCGDYHSLSQAQRTVIRILRDILPRLKKEKKTLYLGLEILRARDTVRAQQFLNGQISEENFLEAVAFERWGFDWQNYRPLFDICREWNVPVFGLSPDKMSSLQKRDQFAADIITNWSSQFPKAMLMCLMGDLHLAKNHLPAEIQTALARKKISRQLLTVHQNHDELYWKLAQKNLELKTEVIKLSKRNYCILNTPPWIKLQNHLKWMELTAVLEEESDAFLSEIELEAIRDPLHDIHYLVQEIASVIGFDRKRLGGLDSIQIVGPQNRQQQAGLYLYPQKTFLLSEGFGLNQLATQSAQYIHGEMSGFKKIFNDVFKDFYPFVWVEALGFLGSKLINPRRKCYGEQDFRASKTPLLQLAARHLEHERKKTTQSLLNPPADKAQAFQLIQILGKLLGQGLFELIHRGEVSQNQLKELFQSNFDETSGQLYLFWVQRLDRWKLRDFSYRDKL